MLTVVLVVLTVLMKIVQMTEEILVVQILIFVLQPLTVDLLQVIILVYFESME